MLVVVIYNECVGAIITSNINTSLIYCIWILLNIVADFECDLTNMIHASLQNKHTDWQTLCASCVITIQYIKWNKHNNLLLLHDTIYIFIKKISWEHVDLHDQNKLLIKTNNIYFYLIQQLDISFVHVSVYWAVKQTILSEYIYCYFTNYDTSISAESSDSWTLVNMCLYACVCVCMCLYSHSSETHWSKIRICY